MHTYFDDFSSYTPGQPPTGWLLRGASAVTPTIEEVGGSGPAYRLLNFPEVSWQYWDRWALKDGLVVSAPYVVTVKLNFQNAVADRAGLTIAWNDAKWDRIDIQPNVYGDDIEFRVTYTGPIHSRVVVTGPASQGGGLPINANTDYWLRVSATSTGSGNGALIGIGGFLVYLLVGLRASQQTGKVANPFQRRDYLALSSLALSSLALSS